MFIKTHIGSVGICRGIAGMEGSIRERCGDSMDGYGFQRQSNIQLNGGSAPELGQIHSG